MMRILFMVYRLLLSWWHYKMTEYSMFKRDNQNQFSPFKIYRLPAFRWWDYHLDWSSIGRDAIIRKLPISVILVKIHINVIHTLTKWWITPWWKELMKIIFQFSKYADPYLSGDIISFKSVHKHWRYNHLKITISCKFSNDQQ